MREESKEAARTIRLTAAKKRNSVLDKEVVRLDPSRGFVQAWLQCEVCRWTVKRDRPRVPTLPRLCDRCGHQALVACGTPAPLPDGRPQ